MNAVLTSFDQKNLLPPPILKDHQHALVLRIRTHSTSLRIIMNLPSVNQIANHLKNSRIFDTDSLFKGNPVLAPLGGVGTQLWLEKGVRMNVLSELTGRIALNKSYSEEWHKIFNKAYNLVQYEEACI